MAEVVEEVVGEAVDCDDLVVHRAEVFAFGRRGSPELRHPPVGRQGIGHNLG